MTATRLGPLRLLALYRSSPGLGEDKILSFANTVSDYYLNSNRTDRAPLSDLDISSYTHNSLRRAGYAYIDEIQSLRDEQLLQVKNIGVHGLLRIKQALAAHTRARRATHGHLAPTGAPR